MIVHISGRHRRTSLPINPLTSSAKKLSPFRHGVAYNSFVISALAQMGTVGRWGLWK